MGSAINRDLNGTREPFFFAMPLEVVAVVEELGRSQDLNDTSEPAKIQEAEARYSTFGQCELKHI